jgi:aspartate aminotransferase
MFEISNRISSMSASLTIEISDLAKKLKSEGKDIISFSAGEPDFDTPKKVKDEAIKAINDGFTKYTAVDGIPALKKVIIDRLNKYNNISYEEDEIIINNGAKQSLFNAFSALVNSGDEVIIPAPYWVSYPELVKVCDGVPVILDTTYDDEFKIDINKLSKLINKKTKMIVITTPSNPTGTVYSKEELTKIADLLKGTNIIILSDEIYDRLVFDDLKFVSPASINEDMLQRTITINGASKSAAMTGWRMGFSASKNKAFIKATKKLQSQSTSNINSITQQACIKVFDGSIEEDIENMRIVFQKRRDLAMSLLSEIKGIRFHKPEGAFYLFVDISSFETNCLDFCKNILQEKGIALVPGVGFGSSGYFRMSYATSDENIKNGIAKIKNFIESKY